MTYLRVLLLPSLLALAVAVAVFGPQMLSRSAEATGGALLGVPSADCTPTSATVYLNWTPAEGATAQWIEYSVHDNGFAAGTFSILSVDANATSHSVAAIRHDLPNFWRVMSQTAGGVIASETGEFMPCYRPILLVGAVECFASSAQVTFRWAPLAAPGGQQVLEYDNDGDFAGNDLISVGPIAPWDGEHRRGGFQPGVEYYFRVVRIEDNGTRLISQQGYFVPYCATIVENVYINPDLYPSDDWIVAPRLGINAPVNVRDVGYDGALGIPAGGTDTVRYNFGAFPTLHGLPGGPGTVLVGGHVDYYEMGLAVFAPLRQAQVGDVVEYWDGNIKYTYVVDWVTDIPFSDSLNPYVQNNGGPASLLMITCNGVFDRAQYGGYNLRRLVHAVLVP